MWPPRLSPHLRNYRILPVLPEVRAALVRLHLAVLAPVGQVFSVPAPDMALARRVRRRGMAIAGVADDDVSVGAGRGLLLITGYELNDVKHGYAVRSEAAAPGNPDPA